MIPCSEPNSLPSIFSDRQDWRAAYNEYVKEFKNSKKTYSDEVLLKIHLRRLGFVGVRLQDEFRYITENC